ncbi:MAG: class I SAM-dependent methyltransferase [Leptolinea sp.]|nr:class I SAM-dependent methyltransferase [Leptolinea sp.]
MTDRKTAPDSAAKWNERYRTDTKFTDAPARSLITSNTNLLPASGRVLEIAGGMGKTTDFLQCSGLDVIELDISLTALQFARQKNPLAYYIVADARHIPLKTQKFDVVCNSIF